MARLAGFQLLSCAEMVLPGTDKRFKGIVGETSERQGGAHKGFSEDTDTTLNLTERGNVKSTK